MNAIENPALASGQLVAGDNGLRRINRNDLKLKKLNPFIYFFCTLEKDLQYLIWQERVSVHLPDHQFHVRTHSESQAQNKQHLTRGRDLSSVLTLPLSS